MINSLNCLEIKNIKKNEKRIEYFYEATGKWREFLNEKENMFIEYDSNIEDVPDSIAIIPFICNILPICWIFDLKIKVDVIDKEFYECIPEVKNGYSNMYPTIPMLGIVEVNDVEENIYNPKNTGTLFSGGVDAFNTLFQHIDEKPILLTLWGADIHLDDEKGWRKVAEHHISVAKEYNLEYSFIKTNFRTFINEMTLSNYVWKMVNGEWWHDFQHGIAILGHIAPIAYKTKMKIVYIASSNTKETRKRIVCASDPTIDNYVKYANCKVIHDGFEFTRQDKVHNICTFLEKTNRKSAQLRVCWKSSGGENCCECEKCYRTIIEIIAEKHDPRNFGFNLSDAKRRTMMAKMPRLELVKYNFANYYSDAQEILIKNYKEEDTPEDLMWFRKYKFKKEKPKYKLFIERIWRKTKNIIKKIIRRK